MKNREAPYAHCTSQVTFDSRRNSFAVRQAPVLWRNLQNHLAGRPLTAYRPQRRFLSLLCTGDGRALFEYRGFSSHSRCAWMLKDWIDRRFVRQFRIE